MLAAPAYQRDADSKIAGSADSPEYLAGNELASVNSSVRLTQTAVNWLQLSRPLKNLARLETPSSRADLAGSTVVNSLRRNDSAFDSMVAGTVGSSAR
jgi:hypothetical protein